MNTFLKLTAASGMLAFLAGCASATDIGNVGTARSLKPGVAASNFTKALAKDYATYAVFEADDEGEWGHGGAFARKAIAAAKNADVEPEDVAQWSIPKDRVAVLNQARAKMMDKFSQGGKKSYPHFAARAQAQFDCWVEEEAEGDTDSGCMANHKAAIWRVKLKAVAVAAAAVSVSRFPLRF